MRQTSIWIRAWRSRDGEKLWEAHYSDFLALWIWKLIIKFNSWLTRESECFNIWCQMFLQKKKKGTEMKLSAISPNMLFFSSEHLINLDSYLFNYLRKCPLKRLPVQDKAVNLLWRRRKMFSSGFMNYMVPQLEIMKFSKEVTSYHLASWNKSKGDICSKLKLLFNSFFPTNLAIPTFYLNRCKARKFSQKHS